MSATKIRRSFFFTAGLLHDIGKVIFIKEADDYFHLVSICEEQGKIVHEEERRGLWN